MALDNLFGKWKLAVSMLGRVLIETQNGRKYRSSLPVIQQKCGKRSLKEKKY